MQDIENLFKEYNDVVKKTYLNYYMEVESKPFSVYNKSEDEFEKKLEKDIRKWEYKPSKSVNGDSPSEYFDSIEEDLDYLLNAFRKGSKICDRDLPHSFVNKLRSYGDRAIDELASMASDRSMIEDEDNRIISLMAIRVLGMWKETSHAGELVELLGEYAGKTDIVAEEIKDSFVAAGKGYVEILVGEINEAEEISEPEEYMIMALAEIGENCKSEGVYRCLRNAFKRMDKKAIGAICLGTYGDGRAVTVLRGYAEKNIDSIDRITFYEIKSQVEKLGGNMDDIVFRE